MATRRGGATGPANLEHAGDGLIVLLDCSCSGEEEDGRSRMVGEGLPGVRFGDFVTWGGVEGPVETGRIVERGRNSRLTAGARFGSIHNCLKAFLPARESVL
jgi:hypothetical protein